ncbi:50S ribosomal protein L14e [Candidatus Bathyarchaeota archaeon]|nr:50S ribosomal protein L14e [Candidatus Bathyarchaeota archaeon]TFH13309.1 MAG: 50S ribosomal protein L14e [Candidatus Bathyarchaeota archaeon]
MIAIDIGRVCMKLQGREKGKKCVIIDVIDRNFVVVAGPGVKRRRVNMDHILALDETVNVQRDASDAEIAGALK